MKTQAFFVGVGERQGVYICSSENEGNSFYIAPLSDTSADTPQSAHQPTHLGPIQRPIFKAAMHTRFVNGAHYGAYAPIGYIKDPNKTGHLLVDEETKWIIEKIFNLAIHGAGAAKITRLLLSSDGAYRRASK